MTSTTFDMGGSETQGFTTGSSRPPGIPERTWQEKLQATVNGLLAGAAILHGGAGPVNPPHPVKLPAVTAKRGRPDKTVLEEETDKGAGSKFSVHTGVENLRSWLDFGRDSLNDLADSVARGTHANSGYGLPGFSAGVEGALR